MKKFLLVSVVISNFLFASEEIVKIGQETSKALFDTLAPKLQNSIKENGILKASEFCANEAQTLTKEVNKNLKAGVSVKRVSLKNRNELNAPNEIEINALKTLEANRSLTYFISESEKSYKFFKPIIIEQVVCLKCHGDENTIDKSAKEFLSKKYPNDKASGFKMGDLRGAFVVEIDKINK
jgi:hypothetical protein